MAGCSKISGTKTSLRLIPNNECKVAPTVHRVIVTTVATAFGTKLGLALDPAYVAGGYTVASSYPLYAGTTLYFGAGGVTPVKVISDGILSLTGTLFDIDPATAAVAALTTASTADSYLSARLCLETKNMSTSVQNGQANEDCGDNLLVSVYTGFTSEIQLTGFPGTSAAFWLLLKGIGDDLGSVDFYLDYDGQFGTYGTMQLAPSSDQNNTAASLVGFTASGSVRKRTNHFPLNLLGQTIGFGDNAVVYDAAAVLAANVARKLWGLPALKVG